MAKKTKSEIRIIEEPEQAEPVAEPEPETIEKPKPKASEFKQSPNKPATK